ncbi:hypothetical protein MJ561_05760 [Klebsiella pneumoniae]|nr:hypothetical protein MJ561_05760 [Klebsiella pneumoniae]
MPWLRSMNVPTVNTGMALGLPAVVDTWTKLGAPKNQLNAVPSMLLGALDTAPIEVARPSRPSPARRNRAPLSALRPLIAEMALCSARAIRRRARVARRHMTLWIHTAGGAARYGASAGGEISRPASGGKTGTTNNNVDTRFASIDGSRNDHHTWVGRDNNQPVNCTVPAARRFTSAIWRTRRQRRWC